MGYHHKKPRVDILHYIGCKKCDRDGYGIVFCYPCAKLYQIRLKQDVLRLYIDWDAHRKGYMMYSGGFDALMLLDTRQTDIMMARRSDVENNAWEMLNFTEG